FDELHYSAFHVMGNAAENHAERSRRFTFALARVDDDKTFLVGLGGHNFVSRDFFLGHFHRVSFGILFRLIGHFGLLFAGVSACLGIELGASLSI
ncbi:MAG: hypothetical protein ACI9ZD_002296, partial [Paracoccaceae bacterium]